MVFQAEFPDRFSASGKLCTVHIVDQENPSGGQAFIEQRKCSSSWSIEIRVQRYKTKSFISNIGKGIWKPSFVDHSTCRIWHNMKNRVNISRRKITCFGAGQITGGFYCDILFLKALKSIKKMDFSVWKGCTDQGRKFTSENTQFCNISRNIQLIDLLR